MEPGDSLHLVQQLTAFFATCFQVTGFHRAQIFVAFIDGHSVLCGHFSLGNIIF